jgi:hypothetical protein
MRLPVLLHFGGYVLVCIGCVVHGPITLGR